MDLITGGTGLVGSHLLFQLTSKGAKVKAVYRDSSKLDNVLKLFSYYTEDPETLFARIQWVEAPLNNIPALESAFENISQVYHCAALISFDPNDFKALVRTNEVGTANVVNLCISKNVRKLCYVSSIAALGKTPDRAEIDEETEWKSGHTNPYALTKHLAEMEVWRATQEGVPAVIVNPGVIIGPGFWEGGSGRLFETAAKGSRYYPPGGSGFVSVIDVVNMMIRLMESNIKSERFIAVERNLSYKQILTEISEELGRPAPTVEIPIWILNLLWRIDWLRCFLGGGKRNLSRAQVASLRNRSYYNNNKARQLLGFEYTSLQNGIAFSAKKFKEANPSR